MYGNSLSNNFYIIYYRQKNSCLNLKKIENSKIEGNYKEYT